MLNKIITAQDISQYYLWNTCFTKENLISEVENAGFQYNKIWADAAGGRVFRESIYDGCFL